MAERNLEIFGSLGMIVLSQRAISIGAIAQIQPHAAGSVTITFVSGESICLIDAEADELFQQVTQLVRQLQYAAASAPKRILTH